MASETVVHSQSLADLRGLAPRDPRGDPVSPVAARPSAPGLSQRRVLPSLILPSLLEGPQSLWGPRPAPPLPQLRSQVLSAPVCSENHACCVWLPVAHCRGAVVSCKCRSFVNHSAVGHPGCSQSEPVWAGQLWPFLSIPLGNICAIFSDVALGFVVGSISTVCLQVLSPSLGASVVT